MNLRTLGRVIGIIAVTLLGVVGMALVVDSFDGGLGPSLLSEHLTTVWGIVLPALGLGLVAAVAAYIALTLRERNHHPESDQPTGS